ncbi:MAG: DUF1501 domain-containing protein [Acidimicrobiia bacterium]|nr:DUF1501 domain-containing protein [Acidimicrobiia bacterium]
MMNRRQFLSALAAHPLALPSTTKKMEAKADTLILLWMAGGMAQTETFDPKAYTPFEANLDPQRVLSTFPAIDTVVDNIKISAGLQRMARIMDRATLIRTYQAGDLGHILHSRHQYHWHTGYAPPISVAAPHMGSWISKALGPRHPDVPAFIDIGQGLEIGAESDSLKAFHTAGFLGSEHGPFFITDPSDAASVVRPPAHLSRERFLKRQEQYRMLMEASGYPQESLRRSVDNAYRLLKSPAAKALDLSLEKREVVERYGDTRFGRGCLLARRLTEAGARFIEVTTEYIPFRFWDTHENGHTRARDMKALIDGPVSQLVLDLEERGLLNRTLIVMASEFGRDMVQEGKPEKPVKDQVKIPDRITELKHYGMHRHFTEAGSVLLIGGGAPKGMLYGTTADERPCKVVEKPVRIEELHATIYRLMGIPADYGQLIEMRPFYVTRDGKGRVVEEIGG